MVLQLRCLCLPGHRPLTAGWQGGYHRAPHTRWAWCPACQSAADPARPARSPLCLWSTPARPHAHNTACSEPTAHHGAAVLVSRPCNLIYFAVMASAHGSISLELYPVCAATTTSSFSYIHDIIPVSCLPSAFRSDVEYNISSFIIMYAMFRRMVNFDQIYLNREFIMYLSVMQAAIRQWWWSLHIPWPVDAREMRSTIFMILLRVLHCFQAHIPVTELSHASGSYLSSS